MGRSMTSRCVRSLTINTLLNRVSTLAIETPFAHVLKRTDWVSLVGYRSDERENRSIPLSSASDWPVAHRIPS
jgi:hypothetical protein